jgi:hypothetical protein
MRSPFNLELLNAWTNPCVINLIQGASCLLYLRYVWENSPSLWTGYCTLDVLWPIDFSGGIGTWSASIRTAVHMFRSRLVVLQEAERLCTSWPLQGFRTSRYVNLSRMYMWYAVFWWLTFRLEPQVSWQLQDSCSNSINAPSDQQFVNISESRWNLSSNGLHDGASVT